MERRSDASWHKGSYNVSSRSPVHMETIIARKYSDDLCHRSASITHGELIADSFLLCCNKDLNYTVSQ